MPLLQGSQLHFAQLIEHSARGSDGRRSMLDVRVFSPLLTLANAFAIQALLLGSAAADVAPTVFEGPEVLPRLIQCNRGDRPSPTKASFLRLRGCPRGLGSKDLRGWSFGADLTLLLGSTPKKGCSGEGTMGKIQQPQLINWIGCNTITVV